MRITQIIKDTALAVVIMAVVVVVLLRHPPIGLQEVEKEKGWEREVQVWV